MIFNLVLLSTVLGSTLSVETGELCGVNGADFLNDAFLGQWRVSGQEGCSIGNEQKCYCSPILGDSDPLGPWVWQCNEDATGPVQVPPVPFGPNKNAGKICPATIPVPVGYDPDAPENNGKNPECSVDSPTGQAGDPPCVYDTCCEGGDLTAVCGCVDTTFGAGTVMDGDLQWFCLHSTCDCPSGTTEGECPTSSPTTPAPSASIKAAWSSLTAILSLSAWLILN